MIEFFLDSKIVEICNLLIKSKYDSTILHGLNILIILLENNDFNKFDPLFIEENYLFILSKNKQIRIKFSKLLIICLENKYFSIDLIFKLEIHKILIENILNEDMTVISYYIKIIRIILIEAEYNDFQIKNINNLNFNEIIFFLLTQSEIDILSPTLDCVFICLEIGKKNINSNDENLIAIEFLKNGIVKKLEKLEENHNDIIYEKSKKILETFYTIEDF